VIPLPERPARIAPWDELFPWIGKCKGPAKSAATRPFVIEADFIRRATARRGRTSWGSLIDRAGQIPAACPCPCLEPSARAWRRREGAGGQLRRSRSPRRGQGAWQHRGWRRIPWPSASRSRCGRNATSPSSLLGQSDELDGGTVNVELVMIGRAHPPIVAVSGTGTGTGTDLDPAGEQGRAGQHQGVRPFALERRLRPRP
jgi:hypothetical protein